MRVIEVKVSGKWVTVDPLRCSEDWKGYLKVLWNKLPGLPLEYRDFRPVEWRVLED
jgi:hypothetical protein